MDKQVNILDLVRVVLGILFIMSGFTKSLDPIATTVRIEEYLGYVASWFGAKEVSFPLWLTIGLTFLLNLTEFGVGLMLIFNLEPRIALIIITFMMILFTPKTLWLALNFPAMENTGCFGEVIKMTPWQSFWKNVFIDVLAIVLWVNYKRLVKGIKRKPLIGWIIMMFGLLILQFFTYVRPIEF